MFDNLIDWCGLVAAVNQAEDDRDKEKRGESCADQTTDNGAA